MALLARLGAGAGDVPGGRGEPWTVSGAAVPPPGSAHPRINLWLFGGLPPSGNDPIEVRLTDFRFTPR